MSRQLTSGNLVVSGNNGTFESSIGGFSTNPAFFSVSQSSEQKYEGSFSALFTPVGITTATNVFQNFTFAEDLPAGKNIILSCWIRQKAEDFMLDTDQIFLETQAGETINSQTILTGSQVSSSEFVKLEIDITTTAALSRLLCRIKLQKPDGSPAPIQPINSGLFVDTVQAYTYEEVDYTTLLSHQFTSVNYSKQYRWEILEKNYAGSETEITAGSTPITYQNSIDAEFEEAVIIAGSCNASIIASSITAYDFIQASDRKYIGVLSQHDGTSYQEIWRGYNIPTGYQQEYASGSVELSLIFSDLLADLKNIPFATAESINNRSDIFSETLSSEIEIIGYCLQQLEVFGIDTINVAISYEETNQSASNKALEETYIDPTIFYEFDVVNTATVIKSSKTCAEVIEAILKKYTAKIIHWQEGYYITDFENQRSNSITYRQYDLFGVPRNNTFTSTSNIVEHKAPQSSDHFRLKGRQTVVGTSSYKKVILELQGIIEENGLLSDMRKKDAVLDSNGKFLGYGSDQSASTYYSRIFGQIDFFDNNPSIYVTKEGDLNRFNRVFEGTNSPIISGLVDTWINFNDSRRSDTYEMGLRIKGGANLGAFKAVEGDILRLEIDIDRIGFLVNTGNSLDVSARPPYYQLGYSLKIGSYYYNTSEESWTLTNTLNTFFIESTKENVEINAVFDRDFTSSSDELEIDIFAIKGQFYNIQEANQAAMIASLKDVITSTLPNGSRIITTHPQTSGSLDFDRYYYYELLAEYSVDGSEPQKVIPDDDSNRAWQLVTTVDMTNPVTTTTFSDIRLFYWPQGEKIDGTVEIERSGEPENIAEYRSSLQLFDPPTVNNSKVLYKSITYSDDVGTPTESWTSTNNGTTSIQQHRSIELTKLLQQSRYKINGAIHTDVDLSPLKQYKINEDGNRIFFGKNSILDFKNNNVEAEFTEIASDNVAIDIREHSTAEHSNEEHS